jgi:LysM repeat protein
MASIIGIKIANGEFYPILEENSSSRKRLILTTVHDNQPSMQIDLYRTATNSMTDAQYMGSLVVDNIKPKPKGEPDIEMIISSDSDGNIVADAVDLASPDAEHYVLTVSLKCLEESARDTELPDFEIETGEEPPMGLYQHASMIREKEKRKPTMWIFVLIGLLIILGILAVWLFLFGGIDKFCSGRAGQTVAESSSPEPVKQPEPVKEPEPVKQPEPVQPPPRVEPAPTPVIQAPASPPPPRQQQTSRRRPPVASYNVPATIPREGVDYRIRWGDTLWDISEAFYRDPWLYPRIARYNNIRNPDLIISGRTLRIPPKN